jgi:hypothetical protein
VLALVVLAAGALCVADTHASTHHGGAPSHDLCLVAPGMPTAEAHDVGLPAVGQTVIASSPEIPASALDVLELPPKL